ncbi:MAG: CRTAC1 family protein [Wenzhouxiangella sp.]|nr:CRTAC1 family protein [Wenzhouxiangella sp.]
MPQSVPGHIAPMLLLMLVALPASAQFDGFDRVLAIDSGLNAPFQMPMAFTTHLHAGGAVAGDIDGDGDLDLLVMRGMHSPRLFLNNGQAQFSDGTTAAGLAGIGGLPNGALLADVTGDGALDLLLGGIARDRSNPDSYTPMRLFVNDGHGNFSDATAHSNLASSLDSHSMAMADIDRDGDLDLFVTYWHHETASATGHLWRNLGPGQFEDISVAAGLGQWYSSENSLYNFTPTFTDLDGDGWPDLLISADFGHSRVFLNQGDGTFADATDRHVITDENGMGSTVGDFDNDGDFDWFVTSIWDDETSPYYGTSGNRLYSNDGSGGFADITESAGVREGGWGWGACAADFDNDGWLDIYMVNGYQTHAARFLGQPARLFMNDGDGSFTERAQARNVATSGQGRAVVCFDSDGDGHVDILVQNSHAFGETAVQPQFYRNRGSDNNWLGIRLEGPPGNRHAIGTRIRLEAAGLEQTREIRAGGSYLSSQSPGAHFGLGDAAVVDRVTIQWPDGRTSTFEDIAGNRNLEIDHDELFRSSFK